MGSGGTSIMAFLVGGLLVAVVALGIFMYAGGGSSSSPATVINKRVVDVTHQSHPDHHSWWPWHHDDQHR